jgi:hypothetical protein
MPALSNRSSASNGLYVIGWVAMVFRSGLYQPYVHHHVEGRAVKEHVLMTVPSEQGR